MASNEINTGLPSAPSPGLILFNCEDQSDIIFIVTLDGLKKDSDKWRFPAHSFIIKESSPFFASLVQQLSFNKKSKSIVNIHCQPESFHLLMSYIYKKEVKLNNITKCLALFEIAIKFDLIDLAVICLTFLRSNLTIANVLEIMIILDQFQSSKNNYLNTSSAIITTNRLSNGKTINHLSSSTIQLRHLINLENHLNCCIEQCYQIIDENADNILNSEAIVTIDENLLRSILIRDSLGVSSELTVFNCLDRWSTIQCVKKQKEVTIGNKVEILGANIYLSRYLTMKLDTFQHGPYLSDLLTDEDKEAIRKTLSNQSIPLPINLQQYRLDKPRTTNVQLVSNFNHKNELSNNNQLIKKKYRNFRLLVARKSHLSMKKLLNCLGEAMIGVIQLLD